MAIPAARKLNWMVASFVIFTGFAATASPPSKIPRRQRWTPREVEVLLVDFATGRSFAEGRRLYRSKHCVKCHRMDGDGNEFGPDLTKMNADTTVLDVAKHVIQPSAKINKDHQVTVFQLKSGQTVQGLVVAAGRGHVRVVENPLESSQARKVQLQDVENHFKSSKSLMPEGLLDGLQATEVLDLIAYVYARGDDGHDVYQAASGSSTSSSPAR